MSESAPVDVSLWTTQTALIFFSRVAAQARLDLLGLDAAAPVRRFGQQRVAAGSARISVARPRRAAIFCQSAAKWPVSTISTASPALSVLTSAASHAPVPDAG